MNPPRRFPPAIDHAALARCFEACFSAFRVRCIGGAPEPRYEPESDGRRARLYYRDDHAASVLHEAAHWCLAGLHRHRLPDFGYDYAPPPRTAAQQTEFLRLERRPQALESLFADAAGVPFVASFDDVEDAHMAIRSTFLHALERERVQLRQAMPIRAGQFLVALQAISGRDPAVPGGS